MHHRHVLTQEILLGFIMIFVEPEKKLDVEKALEQFDGDLHKFQFVNEGAYSWTI
mgnify:CR=1 FL=1